MGRKRGVDSISAAPPPPIPLMVVFGLVALLLCFTSYLDFKSQVARTISTLRLLLMIFLVVLLLLLLLLWVPCGGGSGGDYSKFLSTWPWGLTFLALLLLIMLHFQILIHSTCTREISRKQKGI